MPIAIEFFVGHAYAILFFWVLVEQLGCPVPSIPLLLTAGTLSATHRVSFTTALIAVVAACVVSDSTWYSLGRRFGGGVIRVLCKLSLEASTCVATHRGLLHQARRRNPALRQIRPRPLHRRRSHRRPDRHALLALPALRPLWNPALVAQLPLRRPLLRRCRQAQPGLLRPAQPLRRARLCPDGRRLLRLAHRQAAPLPQRKSASSASSLPNSKPCSTRPT